MLQEKIIETSQQLDELLNAFHKEEVQEQRKIKELIECKKQHIYDLMYSDEVIREFKEKIEKLKEESLILEKVRLFINEFF